MPGRPALWYDAVSMRREKQRMPRPDKSGRGFFFGYETLDNFDENS